MRGENYVLRVENPCNQLLVSLLVLRRGLFLLVMCRFKKIPVADERIKTVRNIRTVT
jgi:hypothetical protein